MAYPRRAIITPRLVLYEIRLPLLIAGLALVVIAGATVARTATTVETAQPVPARAEHVDRSGPRPTLTATPSAEPAPTPEFTPTPTVTSPKATPKATAKPTAKATPKPTPKASATTPKATTSTAGGGSCPTLQGGGTARTRVLHQALCARFPQVKTYYGARNESGSFHGTGQAIDAMVYSDRATGQAIADWARANAGTYGITEVIWQQRIWTTQRASEGWRVMADRGSITQNHFDHCHISVR
ncbi:hypothetical protein [Citricoccus sp.]|uniref:hypothetical protein n=1 Tax=Citricoccus sp. TaxID=1978372 RepID=UPI002C01E5E6|nr:hypothetical protein [Citricoccus sp.]HRO95082.1 hypothetical protein [Citricoccus sp.]